MQLCVVKYVKEQNIECILKFSQENFRVEKVIYVVTLKRGGHKLLVNQNI
jgi:hypothetical protein